MQPSFPRLVLVRAAAVSLVLIVSSLALEARSPAPPTIWVTVDGEGHLVRAGTTLGRLLRSVDVRPEAGRLLDVSGRVLVPRAEPGGIFVNGLPAGRDAVLDDGDRVLVVDGGDRAEGTLRVVTPMPGRRPADPQFTLTTWPVEQVAIEGRISGELVSMTYRPVGRPRRPPEVALTFDDGPWPRSTRRILHVLERRHVRATFFVVGSLVQRYPGVVRDLLRADMAIGNHSWRHPERFDLLSDHRVETEMERTNEALERFSVRPHAFRPPGGAYGDGMIQAARELGMRVVLWDVDALDWRARATKTDIVRAVLRHVRPGSIVLLHDGGGRQSATAAALPQIIKGIRRRGLRLVALR